MANILVADDEASLRMLIESVLTMDGHSVAGACNGMVAMELYSNHHYDLVITDLVMPAMEGLDAILEMKRRNPSQHILAISGGGRGCLLGYLDLAISFGADEVLTKPFTLDELRGMVEKILNGKLLLAPVA